MPFRARTYIGSLRDVLVVQEDATRVRRRQPDRHIERRRLSRAVRPEQADDLAGPDLDADTADDRPSAVRLGEPLGAQCRHASVARLVSSGSERGHRGHWHDALRAVCVRRPCPLMSIVSVDLVKVNVPPFASRHLSPCTLLPRSPASARVPSPCTYSSLAL